MMDLSNIASAAGWRRRGTIRRGFTRIDLRTACPPKPSDCAKAFPPRRSLRRGAGRRDGEWQRPIQRAFTLIELLAVIAILAVLLALLAPALRNARDLARTTQCLCNMRQIGVAVLAFTAENNRFPYAEWSPDSAPGTRTFCWMNELIPGYLKVDPVFTDPIQTNPVVAPNYSYGGKYSDFWVRNPHLYCPEGAANFARMVGKGSVPADRLPDGPHTHYYFGAGWVGYAAPYGINSNIVGYGGAIDYDPYPTFKGRYFPNDDHFCYKPFFWRHPGETLLLTEFGSQYGATTFTMSAPYEFQDLSTIVPSQGRIVSNGHACFRHRNYTSINTIFLDGHGAIISKTNHPLRKNGGDNSFWYDEGSRFLYGWKGGRSRYWLEVYGQPFPDD